MAKKKPTTLDEFLLAMDISPEVYAEYALMRFQKATTAILMWWENHWMYLAREREKRIDEIKASLLNAGTNSFRQHGLSRIVMGNHTRSPLSVVGSLKVPGRFNIGDISPSLRSFGCLYLASDELTARAEKFLNDSGAGDGNLSAEEMYTKPNGPYLHCTVDVELTNLLDLRNKSVLKDFLEVVREIKIPTEMKKRAKYLKIKPLPSVAKDLDSLMATIFELNFTQWQTFINLPSNSQWMGFYAYLAGMQGIIYPSLRNPKGFNLAVFPEHLKDTSSFVELAPKIEHVSSDNLRMDANTYQFFSRPLPAPTIH